MLTRFGQFARQLRIQRSELLKDMATLLKVSPAFLSAVETGNKSVPATWGAQITDAYRLTSAQAKELQVAIDESQRSVSLDLSKVSPERRAAAVAFARDFDKLSDQQLEMVRKALTPKKER